MPIVMYKDADQIVTANHTFSGNLTFSGVVTTTGVTVGEHYRQQWNFYTASPSNSATSFVHFNWTAASTPSATETLASGALTLFIKPGYFDAFQVTVATAPGAGKAWTFSVRNISTGNSSLVANITGTTTTSGIVTGAVRFLQGELWNVQIVPSGTPVAPVAVYFALSGTFDS